MDKMIELNAKNPAFHHESLESFQDGEDGDSVEELIDLIDKCEIKKERVGY
ncbi:hypothetical protein ACVR05_00040 [Streptococcus caprae]|uniref:Uncharacterized protein n=1 Tax=Streptococcus caprae TaxID=1640501 RepID=A0ABV8CX95_9STRE